MVLRYKNIHAFDNNNKTMKIIYSMYRAGEVSVHRACCERATQPYSLGGGGTNCQVSRPAGFGKELFILFAASAFRKLASIYVFSYFPFGFEGRIWDLIVSVPDHCLSFYFTTRCPRMVTECLLTRLMLIKMYKFTISGYVPVYVHCIDSQ